MNALQSTTYEVEDALASIGSGLGSLSIVTASFGRIPPVELERLRRFCRETHAIELY